MRRTTALSSIWRAETAEGESLTFEKCKGGFFSNKDEYGLKLIGKTTQDSGTRVSSNLSNTTELTGLQISGLDGYERYIAASEMLKAGKTYTLSFRFTNFQEYSETYGSTIYMIVQDTSHNDIADFYSYGQDEFSWTFTPEYDMDIFYLWFCGQLETDNATFDIVDISITTEVSYPSPESPETIQCVKAGTKIHCCGKNLLSQGEVDDSVYPAANVLDRDTVCSLPIGTNAVYSMNAANVGGGHTGVYMLKKTTASNKPSLVLYDSYNTKVEQYMTNQINIAQKYNPNDYYYMAYYSGARGAGGYMKDIQLEIGDTATPYEPYVGNRVTLPVDLYEDDIWYPMSGKVERHNGIIESYDGEAITTNYFSTTGALTEGAKVVYRLEAPIIEYIEPTPIVMPSGTINILQEPTDLVGTLEATALARR